MKKEICCKLVEHAVHTRMSSYIYAYTKQRSLLLFVIYTILLFSFFVEMHGLSSIRILNQFISFGDALRKVDVPSLWWYLYSFYCQNSYKLNLIFDVKLAYLILTVDGNHCNVFHWVKCVNFH